MCGIWGYVDSTNSIEINAASEGLEALRNRGPDDWGMYIDGFGKITDEKNLPSGQAAIVLGSRRLSILDLSKAGNQPMSNEDGHRIVYNGEVYNYRELREDLQASGYEFQSETDTEVILRAYQEYGEKCVNHFRGMFAFAIYDDVNGTVFAARDRFGIKPFYYDWSKGRLAFASEVTALLEADVTPSVLDPTSVDGFLALGYVPGPRTIIEGVRALPAGSSLVYDIENETCDVKRYWMPRFGGGGSATADRIRELLAESVRLRLRSDVTVGAFLSGGLDSSSIVGLMRVVANSEGGDLRTYSIGFDQDEYSETSFAQRVADAFGTAHTTRTVSASDIQEELDGIIAAMDQPTIDGVNTYFVSKLAREDGLKVALSGLGSDELLFGYPSFKRVPRWYLAARSLYVIPSVIRRPIAAAIGLAGDSLTGVPIGKIADAIRGDTPFGAAYMTERGIFSRGEREDLMGGNGGDSWEEYIGQSVKETLKEAGIENAVSNAELTWYMQEQLLRDTDVMSMSHSLEVRIPFLDTSFAEYAMGASASSKRGGEKGLLKEAMRGIVPSDVIDREKTGFTFPFGEWLEDELNGVVERSFDPEQFDQIPLCLETAKRIRRQFNKGDTHWSRLWSIVVLSLWAEEHIDD